MSCAPVTPAGIGWRSRELVAERLPGYRGRTGRREYAEKSLDALGRLFAHRASSGR